MLSKIFIGVAVVLVGFLAYVALQPSDYEVSRQVLIDASAEKVFPYLNNSKLGDQWGPWKDVDPQAVMHLEGPEEGVGSRTTWDSPGNLGKGSATIVESIPNERVVINIEYSRPANMAQVAEYLITPVGARTQVTWKVSGKNNFIGRIMCVFMNMDKMVGGMFEKGLANLKKMVEEAK